MDKPYNMGLQLYDNLLIKVSAQRIRRTEIKKRTVKILDKQKPHHVNVDE